MGGTVQKVALKGGPFDGRVAEALDPPAALSVAYREGEEDRIATYIYLEGHSQQHPEHGEIPTMLFTTRVGGPA